MEFIAQHPVMTFIAFMFASLMLILSFNASRNPYQVTEALMTKAEMNFYFQLLKILPGQTHIFTKVRIADVIDVRPSIKGNSRIKHFREIAAKHLDFVLVDREMKILAAIELNDKSHERKDRKERDKFVRGALQSAKVPFFEIPCTKRYDLSQLQKDLALIAGNKSTVATSSHSPIKLVEPSKQPTVDADDNKLATNPTNNSFN